MKKLFKHVLPEIFVACAIILLLWNAGEIRSSNRKMPVSAQTGLTIHFIDVGQGMATLAESGGQYMLVDGGGYESADKMLGYLETAGVERLNYLVISHYDSDHLYGAVRVLENYEVGQVLCPDYETDSATYHYFTEMIAQADDGLSSVENGVDFVNHPKPGESFEFGDCSFTVVSPVRMDYPEENNLSLGIRLVCGEVSFLMMGDAELESEYDMCDSGLPLKSTVYLVNHHGSSSSSSQQLLKTIQPEYAVISCGQNNDYGHPAGSVLERLEEFGVEVFRTDIQGTVTARTDGNEIQWAAEKNLAEQ